MNAKFEFFVLEKTRTNKAFDLIIILVWSYILIYERPKPCKRIYGFLVFLEL